MAPIMLTELKNDSITVFGKKGQTLPINIERNSIDTFLYKNINSYWKNWIKKCSSIFERRLSLFLFPRMTEWSVLGVGRQLYTLQTGKITSKTQAGYYCLETFPPKFHSIITQSIKIRKTILGLPDINKYGFNPSRQRVSDTIECVNLMIDHFNTIYENKYSAPKKI